MKYLGVDIGSISVKAAIVSEEGIISENHYVRTHGQPVKTTLNVLKKILSKTPADKISGIALTGSGGMLVSDLLKCYFVNEVIAQSKATSVLYPDVRTVVEIGGEDSKLIILEKDPLTGQTRLKDFAMNTVCAAGTGSFLDQQAARLGVAIEKEFGSLAVMSSHPPRIAGRCSVFAKSDMIHLQQVATPVYDIIMGLCLALARNFKSTVTKGLALEKPLSFQGGVAANKGMVKAFEMALNLKPGELFIPEHFTCLGAAGAVLSMIESQNISRFRGTGTLEKYLTEGRTISRRHEPLFDDRYRICVEPEPLTDGKPADAYLGIDVGSISTNLIVIDRNKKVLARRYLMTAGKPIEAVRQGLIEIGKEIGSRVVIKGAATTGSGRYLTGDFIGADVVKNEITAHACGAANINPKVDTVFEIGGQDSKYISMENGAVVDFTMNKVCAAGTGSFLEEQAEKLGINIKEEFGRLALSSKEPAVLGERCTVFMESSLNHQQQLGVPKEDLVSGLSYSIVMNYLTKVVEDRHVGNVIFFQGGTAYNRGVKAAFEKVCGKKVIVPPHHDVLGALGAALIALENKPDGPSKFKGFDLANRKFSIDSFECKDCPNNCEIHTVSIEGEEPLKYGSRCGKFDEEKRPSLGKSLPRLFEEREKMLLTSYEPPSSISKDAPVIGIPRATMFFEMYPFWKAFFSELGFRVEPSPQTTRNIINKGCEAVVEEICFPIKVGLGHTMELLEKKVDYLFLPCVVNADNIHENAPASYCCPLVQGLPYLAKAALDFSKYPSKVLMPVFHFEWGTDAYVPQLKKLALELGCRGKFVDNAIKTAFEARDRFKQRLIERGKEVLANLPEGVPALVIVSRPYNGCDSGVNVRIPDKLRDLGALAIPVDFLQIPEDADEHMETMYWRYGQRILASAGIISSNPRLNAVYITNFACGPDSFIIKYFKKAMSGKHYLTLELDEHSADAGVITRLEAFLDSLSSDQKISGIKKVKKAKQPFSNHRKIFIPYMDDHGLGIAAAMRYYGIDAETLPMGDEKSVDLARNYTTGKECYPFLITTGDILKKVFSSDFDPDRSSFFMPTAMGPCRFGQYCHSHRLVLDEIGMNKVPMVLLDQTVNYDSDLNKLGNGFRKLGWQAVNVIDNLKKLFYQTRPYETNRGETDSVYGQCLQYLKQSLSEKGSVEGCPEHIVKLFSSIPVDRAIKKPRIGIIGEIYVRSNEFSNNFIIRKIEELGGEVVMPTFQEWIMYTDWERKFDFKRIGEYRKYFEQVFKSCVQQYYTKKIAHPFKDSVKDFLYELPTESVLKLSEPYLTRHIRGEAGLSMGRAEEYAEHSLNGIVNLAPFHCMPGTIANTLLCQFSKKHPKIPVLKMVYDGTKQSGEITRVEAFMFQTKQVLAATQQVLA